MKDHTAWCHKNGPDRSENRKLVGADDFGFIFFLIAAFLSGAHFIGGELST
jgi:hypothetical protein